MASDHLGPHVKVDSPLMPAGHGFGLGFAVRTHQGMAPFPGSLGQFFWSGMAGTFFWIDPAEEMFAVLMMQGPGQREYIRLVLPQPGLCSDRAGSLTRPGRGSSRDARHLRNRPSMSAISGATAASNPRWRAMVSATSTI